MVINSTLLSLSISGFFSESPLLTSSTPNHICNARLSKSFSSFVHSSNSFSSYGLFISNTLKASIFIEKTSISSVTYKSQYIPTGTCSFYWCLFNNSASTGSAGSAIYSNSGYVLYFSECMFTNCYTNYAPSAAAIFSNGNLTIGNCCFDRCYNGVPTDDYFTNVIYCSGSSFSMSNSLFLRSAESNSAGADSTFYSYQSLVNITRINFTVCLGTLGGAGGRLDYPTAGSTYNYAMITRSGQYAGLDLIVCTNAAFSYLNIFSLSMAGHPNSTIWSAGATHLQRCLLLETAELR